MALTTDERAMYLLDRILRDGPVRVEEAQLEFQYEGIAGWDEYVKIYGAHITRKEFGGSRWVYKFDYQKKRIEEEIAAFSLVNKIALQYGYVWEDVPMNLFRQMCKTKTMHSRVVEILVQQFNVYVVGGDWNRFHTRNGTLAICGKELSRKNRIWLHHEIEDLSPFEAGSVDADALWEENGFIWSRTVTRLEFDRVVEIINMYETFDEKAIYGVEL